MAEPLPFDYRVIRKPGIRHLYLRIKDGEVYVSANRGVSEAAIADFVQSKRSWIQKHLSRARPKQKLTDTHAQIYLLGKAYPIRIERDQKIKKEEMRIEETEAVFSLHSPAEHPLLVTLRDHYYKKKCPGVISPIVETYSEKMGLYPARLGYRHNRSRWGSCSAADTLSLNTRLMMLPEAMITYVVIHELAHIRHKNHSRSFWELVEEYLPDYKALRRGIRAFESSL